MSELLGPEWNDMEVWADADDAWVQLRDRTWLPPNLGRLVRAVRETTLSRFYPFTSHEALCLAIEQEHWVSDGLVAPGCVGRTREHRYLVWPVAMFDKPTAPVLITHDADEAAAGLERMLADWPPA